MRGSSNGAFGIWIGGEYFLGGCYRPIRMHYLWRELVIRQHRVEQISILNNEVDMRRAIVVPVKHVLMDIMLELKEA